MACQRNGIRRRGAGRVGVVGVLLSFSAEGMTMIRARWAAAAVGVLALFAGANRARADDVLRLNGDGDAQTLTLGFDGQAGTELVARGGGGFRGGFGGFRGGAVG